MFELVYNSIASTTLKEEDLLAIQKISEDANSKSGITGCLFYRGNQFLGILEGGKQGNREEAFLKNWKE